MVSLHRSKYPRQMMPWVLVFVLLVCSLSPASAAAPRAVSSAAAGTTPEGWTATFVASVAARTGHTAVWTGAE